MAGFVVELDNEDEVEGYSKSQLQRPLAIRASWDFAFDPNDLPTSCSLTTSQGVGSEAIISLQSLKDMLGMMEPSGCRPVEVMALKPQEIATQFRPEDLCYALKHFEDGRAAAAEIACQLGAVEAALASLAGPGSGGGSSKSADTLEALWLLIDDYDSCQRFVKAGGHAKLLMLANQPGPVAAGAFRLLAETLYSESHTSRVWQEVDVGSVMEALSWAARLEQSTEAKPWKEGDEVLAAICDVAALTVQRAGGSIAASDDVARSAMNVIPYLLQAMTSNGANANLLQHGCRLLHALARSSSSWPIDLQEQALAALVQVAAQCSQAGFSSAHRAAADRSMLAYQAISTAQQQAPLPGPSPDQPQNAANSLSTMD